MHKCLPIKYVDYGIANNFGSYVELHRDLKDYPELHDAILEHELAHTGKGWSFHDFKVDFFQPLKCSSSALLRFMASRPSTWIQILPFYLKERKVIVDINLCILWGLISIFFFGITLFGFYMF